MNPFVSEFLGTFILIFLGIGVVSNINLKNTFGGTDSGKWLMLTTGWGFAVFFGVIVAGPHSGAHLNPAVTIGFASIGKFAWSQVPIYLIAQFLGSFSGALLAYLFYVDHINFSKNEEIIRKCFTTGPAIRNNKNNFFSELIGTFMFVFLLYFIASPVLEIDGLEKVQFGIGSMDAFPVGVLVWLIGLALGGTTGYAINPARDLAPRFLYSLMRGKKANSDWSYSWIPVVAPIIGSFIAALLYNLLGIVN